MNKSLHYMNTVHCAVMLVSISPTVNTHFCCPRTHTQKAMLTLAPSLVYREGNARKQCLCSSSLTCAVHFSDKVTRGRNEEEPENPMGSFLLLIPRPLFFFFTVWKVRCDTMAGCDDLAFPLHLEHTDIDLPMTCLSCL